MIYIPQEEKKKLEHAVLQQIALEIFKRSQEKIIEYGAVDNGFLLKSGKIISTDKEIIITYDAPYAEYVEYGSYPHFPPVEPIKQWVRGKLSTGNDKKDESIAWAIATKISQEGVKPRPFLRSAADEVLV